MNVIRHDDPDIKPVASVVEMLERSGHGGCIRRIAVQAGAKTLVEELIDSLGEKAKGDLHSSIFQMHHDMKLT